MSEEKNDENKESGLADELNKIEDEVEPKDKEGESGENNDDNEPEEELEEEPEDERNIVDMFVAGDMDAVKREIHNQVVAAVSQTLSGDDSEDDDSEDKPESE